MKVKARLITWDNAKLIRQSKQRVKLVDGRCLTTKIDGIDIKLFLPLHESSLWKLPFYYEINQAIPLTGEPKIEYPKRYLVVSVS